MRFGTLASLTVLAVGLAVTPTLSAQTPDTPQRGPGRMQAMTLNGIALTPAQQSKIDSITANTRAQMPVRTPGTQPSEADREKMRSLSMASSQAIRAVLTAEQQAIYDKNLAELRGRRMQGAGGPPASVPQKP